MPMPKLKTTLVPNWDGKPVHPLLALASFTTQVAMSEAIGHSNHTSVNIYVARARKDRHARVPAEWIAPLCQLAAKLGCEAKPADFRPDVFLPGWKC